MSRIIAILITVIILLFIGNEKPDREAEINSRPILPVMVSRGVSVCDYQKMERQNFNNLLKETHELDSLIQIQNKRVE